MPALICSSCHLRCPVQRSSASWLAVRLKFLSHQFTHQNPNQVVLGKKTIRKVESRSLIHGKNYFCHCCSSIHMLQTTTTKRPPFLTLTGARIFKQRLATILKHRIGSQEPGARVQWTKFSWKYDFPTFSEIILLLLNANKNFKIPNLLATLFRPWL